MNYLNHNGTITRADKAIITADNRSFRYGDGLFETMKMVNGSIPLQQLHFERLFLGIDVLQFEKPAWLTGNFLKSQILELVEKNKHSRQARIRLTVFRGEGGLYDPQNHFPNYIIQTWKLPDAPVLLNENGYITDVFPDARITCDSFSNLKTNNYLSYLMGALYVKKNHLNDCLLLNSSEHICDATIANLFLIIKGKLLTPALTEGCVAGVMRRYIIEQLIETEFRVTETAVSIADLHRADEVFFTNAVYGMKWVKAFRQSVYKQELTTTLFKNIISEIF